MRTDRLELRRWRESDREPFAALNADPEVMEFFPAPLSRDESDAYVDRIETMFDARGYGLWALDADDVGFIGYVGLWPAEFDAPFTPAVEIGWRLAHHAWGHGYASEAARRALTFGFEELGLSEIVSFTAVLNTRSQAVMQRIGMHRDPAGDFDHPNVAPGHPLRPHVLFRSAR